MAVDFDRLRAALEDRYAIESEIGHGGMACVFLARDNRHHRHVAVKVLLPHLAATLGAQRFLREIETAANLNHPHILALHDSGETDGFLYYVMPYVEGESLRQRLDREPPLPVDEALAIAREVADGLGHAHRHGVVHRDIKPENILLSEGHAIIADFGISKAIAEAGGDEKVTETGVAIGSPTYMSPEQVTAEPIDERSDIFSMGCVLYEMLAGHPPFEGSTRFGVMASRLASQPQPLRKLRDDLPENVVAAVEWALEPDPSRRCPTAESLIASIEGEPPPRRVAGGWSRWLAAALVVASLGAAAFALNRAIPGGDASDQVAFEHFDPNHIAVLPFKDRSPNREYGWLAAGLTDELIAALSDVEALTVKSSAATRPYQRPEVTIDSLARGLKVGMVVDGWLEVVRDELRVTVQLIDPATGTLFGDHIRVRAPPSQHDSLRDAMIEQVAVAMRSSLGERVALDRWRRLSVDPAAWEHLQRSKQAAGSAEEARWALELGTAVAMLTVADSLAGAAVAMAPDWIEPVLLSGWIWLGFARIVGTAETMPAGSPTIVTESAVQYLDRGLAVAEDVVSRWPDDPRSLELRGALRLNRVEASQGRADSLLPLAITDLRGALARNDDLPRAWMNLSRAEARKGNFHEAAYTAERALETDAYFAEGPEPLVAAVFAFLREGEFENARRLCRLGRLRFEGHTNISECELIRLGWAGAGEADLDAARSELARIESEHADPELWRYRRLMVAAVLARSGMADSARSVIRRTADSVAKDTDLKPHYFTEAYVYNLLGDLDATFKSLETFLAAAPHFAEYTRTYPWFENLRDNPRFQQLVSVNTSD